MTSVDEAGSGQRAVLVVAGAVFCAGEAAAGLVANARRMMTRAAYGSARHGAAVTLGARQLVVTAARRGGVERDRGREYAATAVDTFTEAVATSALFDRVVDVQLERIIQPLVTRVLDDVLALLEAEPERVRSLIRGQRESMVDELIVRLRDSAAAGDDAVDRLVARVLRRRPEPAVVARTVEPAVAATTVEPA
jgi:hypothetical protein